MSYSIRNDNNVLSSFVCRYKLYRRRNIKEGTVSKSLRRHVHGLQRGGPLLHGILLQIPFGTAHKDKVPLCGHFKPNPKALAAPSPTFLQTDIESSREPAVCVQIR